MKRTNPHEQFCFDTATLFTAVRGANPRTRVRKDCATIEEAEAFASTYGDGRTMIYAVNAVGNSAHIKNA